MRIVKDYNRIAPEIFHKAREIVHGFNFDSIKKYKEWCENRNELFNIPKNPDSVYKSLGWINWADWLNKKIMDKNEIRRLVTKENDKRIIQINNMTNEEKVIHFLNNKNATYNDICGNLNFTNSDNILELNSIIANLMKQNIIKCTNNEYSLCVPVSNIDIIDTVEKFDEWALLNNIPVYDELKEFYDLKDPCWLLGLKKMHFPPWIEFLKICKDYYKNNINKHDNIVDYYNDLKLIYDLPNDPNMVYDKFDDYYSLFETSD